MSRSSTLWQSVKTRPAHPVGRKDGKRLIGFRELHEIRPRLLQQGGGAEQIQATKPEAVPPTWPAAGRSSRPAVVSAPPR